MDISLGSGTPAARQEGRQGWRQLALGGRAGSPAKTAHRQLCEGCVRPKQLDDAAITECMVAPRLGPATGSDPEFCFARTVMETHTIWRGARGGSRRCGLGLARKSHLVHESTCWCREGRRISTGPSGVNRRRLALARSSERFQQRAGNFFFNRDRFADAAA